MFNDGSSCFVIQYSDHLFKFNREFNHVTNIQPDRKFNDKVNGVCCKFSGTTIIKLCII